MNSICVDLYDGRDEIFQFDFDMTTFISNTSYDLIISCIATNYHTLKKVDIKRAGITRPAIDFLIIKLSNFRLMEKVKSISNLSCETLKIGYFVIYY